MILPNFEKPLNDECHRLEQQIAVNVVPTAPVVYEERSVHEVIKPYFPDDEDYHFYVETSRILETSGIGDDVNISLLQTLGIEDQNSSVGLIGVKCTDIIRDSGVIQSRTFAVESSPVLKSVDADRLFEFNFSRYKKILELAEKVISGKFDPKEFEGDGHPLFPTNDFDHRIVFELQPDFINYKHLLLGEQKAEIRSIYRLNGEVLRKVALDALPQNKLPIYAWSPNNEIKIIQPKDPLEALNSFKTANALLLNNLSLDK